MGTEDNNWQTEDSNYSLDDFYTKSTDGRGHGDLVHIKLAPYLLGSLRELVESPEFPAYRTLADILRDSLYHRVHYLSEHRQAFAAAAKLDTIYLTGRMQAKVVQYQNEIAEYTTLKTLLQTTFTQGLQASDVAQLRQTLSDAQAQVDLMRDPFRTDLTQWIQQSLRQLQSTKEAAR